MTLPVLSKTGEIPIDRFEVDRATAVNKPKDPKPDPAVELKRRGNAVERHAKKLANRREK